MLRTTLVLILVALFFAVGGGIIYVKNQTSTRTYLSSLMKVEITYPDSFYLQKSATSVVMKKNATASEQIIFRKYGSMYRDTKSHVDSSILRQGEIPSFRQSISSSESGIPGELVEYVTGGKPYRIYYFVKDNALYQFEANDPALFADLDAIAKSFRILE